MRAGREFWRARPCGKVAERGARYGETDSEPAKIASLLEGSFGGFSKILASQMFLKKLLEML